MPRSARSPVPAALAGTALLAVFLAAPALAQEAPASPTQSPPADWWMALSALGTVLAAAVGLFLYLWFMQQRFLAACREAGEIAIYARTPAGVPVGTVRAVIALFIIFTAVGLLSVSLLRDQPFPEIMSGILGTVLGFYFGARTGSRSESEDVLERVDAAHKQRDAAVREAAAGKVEGITGKVRDGLDVARSVGRMLPGEVGKRFERVASVVEDGLGVVERLRGEGRSGEALEKATELASRLREESPLRRLLSQAAGSFGKVLGTAVPPLAIATAVVGIGSRLAGAAYDRWVARVLQAPYSAELFPPSAIDANTAISLLRRSPIFAQAFAPEIEAGDRQFLRHFLELALSEDRIEALWQESRERFDDRAQFDDGLAEFQRHAMGLEASRDVPDEAAAEVGSVEDLLAAIDRLHADPEARRDLDALVLVADEIKREGGSPEAVLRETRGEVEAAT